MTKPDRQIEGLGLALVGFAAGALIASAFIGSPDLETTALPAGQASFGQSFQTEQDIFELMPPPLFAIEVIQ